VGLHIARYIYYAVYIMQQFTQLPNVSYSVLATFLLVLYKLFKAVLHEVDTAFLVLLQGLQDWYDYAIAICLFVLDSRQGDLVLD